MISRRIAIKRMLSCIAGLSINIPLLKIAKAQEPIKWGSLIPLSIARKPAEDIRASVDIAIKAITEEGGLKGRPIKHIIIDEYRPTQAIQRARELILEEKVSFLGAGLLGNIEYLYRLACKEKILLAGYTSPDFHGKELT